MFFVFGEMKNGIADYEIEPVFWERHIFDWRGLKIFRWQIRGESFGEMFYLPDGGGILVNGEDVKTFAQKIIDVAPAAASRIEDFHFWKKSVFLNLVEEIDVYVAECFADVFHILLEQIINFYFDFGKCDEIKSVAIS